MTQFMRKQVAQQLSLYFKNISPDQFNLSFFSGRAELTDLELKEDVPQRLLGFPSTLQLVRGTCCSVRAEVSWTKIVTQPIKISIGHTLVILRLLTEAPNQNSEEQQDVDEGLKPGDPPKVEKYGFIDSVIDGVRVTVDSIMLTIEAEEFNSTIHFFDLVLASTTQNWITVNDLRQTRLENKARGIITVFKELVIGNVIGIIYTTTDRLAEDASSDPLKFKLNKPRIRMTRVKRLNNNLAIVLARTTFVLEELKQEFSRFQVQAAIIVASAFDKMISAGRGQQSSLDEEKEEVSASVAPGQEIFELKFENVVVSLKNPMEASKNQKAHKTNLTRLTASGISVRHYAEQPFGCALRSKESLRQCYLDDRQKWVDRINEAFTRKKIPQSYRKRMRQAITFLTIQQLNLSVLPHVDLGSGIDESPSGDTSKIPQNAKLIPLLATNFEQYNLPEDTPLLQLVFTWYYAVASNEDGRASPVRKDLSSDLLDPQTPLKEGASSIPSTPRTPARDYAGFIPPGHIFSRMNPFVLNLDQAVLMQLIRFAKSCKLAAPAASGSANFNKLVRQMLRCRSIDQLPAFEKRIEEMHDFAEVSFEELTELRRVYANLKEELAELDQVDDSTDLAAYMRYNIELFLPTLKFPSLDDGPERIANQEMHITASRIIATNCPPPPKRDEENTSSYVELEASYKSSLKSRIELGEFNENLKSTSDLPIAVLPPQSWLQGTSGVVTDRPGMVKLIVDDMWIDMKSTINGTRKEEKLARPFRLNVWLLDTISRNKFFAERGTSRKSQANNSCEYTSSYTVVEIPDLKVRLANHSYMYLMRLLEDFERNSYLLDDGQDLPTKMMMTSIINLHVDIVADDFVLEKTKTTHKCDPGNTLFQVDISNLSQCSYSSFRQAVSLLQIDTISGISKFKKYQPREDLIERGLVNLPRSHIDVGNETRDADISIEQFSMMTVSPLPDPEFAFQYYEAFDKIMEQKENIKQWTETKESSLVDKDQNGDDSQPQPQEKSDDDKEPVISEGGTQTTDMQDIAIVKEIKENLDESENQNNTRVFYEYQERLSLLPVSSQMRMHRARIYLSPTELSLLQMFIEDYIPLDLQRKSTMDVDIARLSLEMPNEEPLPPLLSKDSQEAQLFQTLLSTKLRIDTPTKLRLTPEDNTWSISSSTSDSIASKIIPEQESSSTDDEISTLRAQLAAVKTELEVKSTELAYARESLVQANITRQALMSALDDMNSESHT
eukprot:m.136390 g.136390  ORF g.136390 m.136390 type:complete len:1236 (-) comp14732_c0_seq1:1033-4740(-)